MDEEQEEDRAEKQEIYSNRRYQDHQYDLRRSCADSERVMEVVGELLCRTMSSRHGDTIQATIIFSTKTRFCYETFATKDRKT